MMHEFYKIPEWGIIINELSLRAVLEKTKKKIVSS